MRNSKVMKRLVIDVSESVYGGMTNAELSDAKEKEYQLVQQDSKIEDTKDKKNALESYVYEMRDKV
jgi:heat shock protein 4